MPSGLSLPTKASRDLRIDWLRGLAMTCVIINHSRMSSLLSWFSYERFWVVTAAEVFVVLSGTVLGMVYGRRLAGDGWRIVVQRLSRRTMVLYGSFIAVTVSVLVISLMGIDISSLTTWDDRAAAWFIDPRQMNAAAWRDVALMRYGPWTFEIVGLYVFLMLAAVPCLLGLRFAGCRAVLGASWIVYLWYQIAPHRLTSTEFESVFPILAWQLLFVHGIALGYHREKVSAHVARWPKAVLVAAAGIAVVFMAFALSNPRADGPLWLRLAVVTPAQFTHVYTRYFALSDLGIGRVANLAVALPLGYGLLTWCWTIARRFGIIFVTLGQQSLGAFVLHVYGLLLISNLPHVNTVWVNTIAQLLLIVVIAGVLNAIQRVRVSLRTPSAPIASPRPLAA